MKKKEAVTTLGVIERGVQLALIDSVYQRISGAVEHDIELRAKIISLIGTALGETLHRFEYPLNWRRFLERKDCPQYMKTIYVGDVSAWYPRLSLPDEPHKITFNKGIDKEAHDMFYDEVKQ